MTISRQKVLNFLENIRVNINMVISINTTSINGLLCFNRHETEQHTKHQKKNLLSN